MKTCKKEKIKLNNQKGITAAEAVIAMVIILITVGVIATVYTNLSLNSSEIDRKAGATRIATNITENMNEVYYNEVKEELDMLYYSGIATKENNTYIIPPADGAKVFNTTIPNGYTCKITLENVNGSTSITKATIEIDYTVNKLQKGVSIIQVLEKETVRECNSPRFSEQYIRQIISEVDDYIMVSSTAKDIQSGVKIICPIKYDKVTGSYMLVEDVLNNPIWYSYSNKNWAKILILDVKDYNKYIDYETKKVDNSFFANENNLDSLYVWIPRFGVQSGGELFGSTYFKYKKTNLPILNSYYDNSSDVISYYINTTTSSDFSWSSSYNLSFDGSIEDSGKWVLYSSLTEVGTDGYYLNKSQYGPCILEK